MPQPTPVNIAVLGASGYTGADLIRLALRHPHIKIKALVAKTHAGRTAADVFPHFAGFDLPDMVDKDAVDWSQIDALFCGLPHGTAHELIAQILKEGPAHLKVIDMSADFRLRDPDTYAAWYGGPHGATGLLKTAVYGLTEHYREDLRTAKLAACPGCYPTATLLALLPLAKTGLIDPADIIIDAKSGVSGAGRGLKQNTLFAETGEGLSPYGIAAHRHAPEIEQELGRVTGSGITVNFTPHLVPMTRGELVSCYVRMAQGLSADDLRATLKQAYETSTFVQVLPEGQIPATQHVRGSNYCRIGVFADRINGRAIVISCIDNLVKGSAGQALQNFNIMHGFTEDTGLLQLPMFP